MVLGLEALAFHAPGGSDAGPHGWNAAHHGAGALHASDALGTVGEHAGGGPPGCR